MKTPKTYMWTYTYDSGHITFTLIGTEAEWAFRKQQIRQRHDKIKVLEHKEVQLNDSAVMAQVQKVLKGNVK